MFSIDLNRIKPLEDLHWEWFWNRAGKNYIELEYFVINQSCPKYKGVYKNGAKWKNVPKRCLSNIKRKYLYKDFWKTFFHWEEKDIHDILFASKDEMLEKIDKGKIFFQKYSLQIKIMNILMIPSPFMVSGKIRTIEDVVYETFGYKDFESGAKQTKDGRTLRFQLGEDWREKIVLWNAYAFTQNVGVDVCPYCGRQYTFTLGDGKEKKNGRPQIDHYIPEAEFPFLSCSLYNFIPSCSSCNHQKSDTYNNSKKLEWKELPYPYEDFEALSKNGEKKFYDDVKFRAFYQVNKKDGLYYGIKIRENGNMLSGVLGNANNAFHLEDLYNMHDLELEDLFTRYRIYTKSRLKNILSVIHVARRSFDATLLKNSAFYKAVISAESCRLKNVILGFPFGTRDRQYPLKKFKEDIVAQLDAAYEKIKKK